VMKRAIMKTRKRMTTITNTLDKSERRIGIYLDISDWITRRFGYTSGVEPEKTHTKGVTIITNIAHLESHNIITTNMVAHARLNDLCYRESRL
jgi:hypothetical protein